MATQPQYLTPEEYLEIERKAEYKSEYIKGTMVAMSGASLAHDQITFAARRALAEQMSGGPCNTFGSDVRIAARAGEAYFYPDVSVCCDKADLADGQADTVLNPVLIVEVLSPSTEAYDRGRKFSFYKMIGSVREYLLIGSQSMTADLYTRQAEGRWLLTSFSNLADVIELQSVGCRLEMAKLYEKAALE